MLRSNNKKFSQITGCKANTCTPGSWIKSQGSKTRLQGDSCTSTVTSYYLGFRDWVFWLWRASYLRKPDGQHLKYFWNSLQPKIIWCTKKKNLPSLEDITDGVARESLVETPQSARKKCSSEMCVAIRKHAERTLHLQELPAWEGLHLPVARDICFCKSKPFYFSQLRFLSLPVQFPLCHTCPFVRWQWRNQRHFWGLAQWSCVEIHPDYGLCTYLCLWLDALLPVVFLC